jgi:hypothetical protein
VTVNALSGICPQASKPFVGLNISCAYITQQYQ